MSGSRLGRGRGGRLAVYGGCGVVVVLLIILYRAAASEMARLRDLHVQCAHQQEALAAQLQVIFEYKVRLEKSLAEEKSSIAAVKQELQERASREKSLRDKDSVEAMRRFHSLQQTYKLLQTEHQDLQDECKKHQKQALEDTTRLEATLQDLRSRIRQAEEKEKVLERLKAKYLELETEKSKLEQKYNEMLKSNGNTDTTIEHLRKEVIGLKRELEEAKKASHKATSPEPSVASPQTSQQVAQQQQPDTGPRAQQQQQDALQQQSDRAQQQQQQQSTAATSSIKSIPALRLESSTKSSNNNNNNNAASTSFEKPLPAAKPPLKVKLPVGVVPIPMMMDKQQDEARRKEEQAENAKPRKHESKENEQQMENGNQDPFPGLQPNAGWLRGVPVQEIGDVLNNVGRVPGLDEGADRPAEAGDDPEYDAGDYEKDPQLKNSDLHLVRGEEEGEDEENELDYPNNIKQDKHE